MAVSQCGAQVFVINEKSGLKEWVAPWTYHEGETFGDIRKRLEGLFDYPFQFRDAVSDRPIHPGFEYHVAIATNRSEIIISPLNAPACVKSPVRAPSVGPASGQTILGSSNASNAPTRTETLSESHDRDASNAPTCTENQSHDQEHGQSVFDDQADTTEMAPDVEPSSATHIEPGGTVSFWSTLMPKHLMKLWASQAQSLLDYMKEDSRKQNRWKVETFDKNSVWMGHITCDECNRSYSATNGEGVMDKVSITSCFTNFKTKHLKVNRHRVALRNRLEPAADDLAQRNADDAAACAIAAAADRDLLDRHVAILEQVNEVQDDNVSTFTIKGDLRMEPLDLTKLKLFCIYCCQHFAFVSKQMNLKTNLESHCDSIAHMDAKARRLRVSSGEAVRSGTAGRPRLRDDRDVRQKTIQGYFSSEAKERSRSGAGSSSAADKGTVDKMSLLCWGLWHETVKYGELDRPVKGILDDQIQLELAWQPESWLKARVWCLTSQMTVNIEGAFRHTQCSRLSEGGGGFEDLICQHCWSIKAEPSFRGRVLREYSATEKRGNRTTGRGRRLGHLTRHELAFVASRYRINMCRERKKQQILRHQLLMARRRVPRISDICSESANRKDLLKFCNSIVLAHNTGAFGGKPALWDMLKDIASNLNRKKEGHRFSGASKMLAQTLLLHGGRRVIDCMADNGIGPSLNTLQRDRRGMAVFHVGIHPQQFEFIGDVFSSLKEKLGITGAVPCYLAEDETTVKKTIRWLPQSDTLLGFCGDTENHKCKVGYKILVGDGETGFNNITTAFEGCVMGHQARCIIVNPLCEGLPRLCVFATATCNKFDALWVREQWDVLKNLWDTHCFQKVGPLLGHASDGDSRRRKLMLQDYTGKWKPERPRNSVGWEGWPLTYATVRVGEESHAYGIHDQDFIHNGKKLINALDSTKRRLQMGCGMASFTHVQLVEERYPFLQHGLTKVDKDRSDRQNWASCQRIIDRRVISCLQDLEERKDGKKEHTLGTRMYLSICADYLDIHMNKNLTLREIVVLCGKVGFFFRLWRLWCIRGNHAVGGYTQRVSFTDCCIPMQTFVDIQISVHFVVFLIIQFRDHFPHIPVPLSRTGSDACEQFFSKVGGMKGHERNYDIAELVDCATSLNRLAAMDASGKVHVGKSHKKHRDIWMKRQLEQLPAADHKDFSGIETNADVVQALKEGFKLAQDAATMLQMNPSTSAAASVKEWWVTPWITEKRGSKFGGWSEVDVGALVDGPDVMDIEVGDSEGPMTVGQARRSNADPSPIDVIDDGVSDYDIAEAGVRDVISSLCSEIENGRFRQEGKIYSPTVTWKGQRMYKSTLVSGFVGNPQLSKDRLTKVKETFYLNSRVDKAKSREGVPTMMLQLGTDCGVIFFEDTEECARETRSKAVAKALKRKGRAKNNSASSSKRPRGEAVAVHSATAQVAKYKWWLGRVQGFRRKNEVGPDWHRGRVSVDLLDRPEPDTCRVWMNWYSPITNGRQKFKYTVFDPQWIDLECIISTVRLSVHPSNTEVYNLDPNDALALDDFVGTPYNILNLCSVFTECKERSYWSEAEGKATRCSEVKLLNAGKGASGAKLKGKQPDAVK